MTVTRSQRTYPLALTADPLNTGIVAAFDWASEDGSTTASNGKDHSGNAHHFTVPTAAPTIVTTAAGKGRDCSVGRTIGNNYYDAAGAVTLGMDVGTGPFSFFKRIRTPSYAPASNTMHGIGRLTDGDGIEKFVPYLYEVTSTNAWHWHVSIGNAAQLLWNSTGNPAIPPNTDSMLHVTRDASGTVKFYVNGVLISSATKTGDTTNFKSTTGGMHTIAGPYGSGNILDVVMLDDIYWNRELSAAEVAAHAANPYSYYANAAPADSITATAPASGATVSAASIAVSGTYAGGTAPTSIEASFNGGAYQTLVSNPTGGVFSGTLTGQVAGTGTLTVRTKSGSTVVATATVSNVTAVSDSISFATPPTTTNGAVPYRTFQRDGTNKASVRITGTYSGSPTSIQYSWGGSAWATLVATPSGGTFDATVNLQGPAQGDLAVRFGNNTAITASIPAIGVGDVYMVIGQSNNVGKSPVYVAPVAPAAHPTWVSTELGKDGVWKQHRETSSAIFDDGANATYPVQVDPSPAGSYFGALASKIMAGGVPVAFVPCALGSTSIATWAVSTATTTLYGAALARAAQIGDHKAVIWWQGEADTFSTPTQAEHEASLNALINDWFARTGRKWFVWAINATGCGSNFQPIHDAIVHVGQTNTNCSGYADLNGAFTSSVHYGTLAEIAEVSKRTFASINTAYSYVTDTTGPTMAGSIAVSNQSQSGYTLAWQAATDDIAVAGYEVSIDGGASYTNVGNVLTYAVSGRPASTTDQVRVRAYDAASNRSPTPLSGAATTSAAPAGADTTAPTMVGSLSSSGITQTGYTLSWQAATDNVGTTGYEYSTDGGTTYATVGNVLSVTVTGKAASTTYQNRVRAFDAAGNRSAPLALPVTTLAASSGGGGILSFSPSTARTLKVLAASLTFEGGAFWDMTNPKRPVGTKDPDSTIDVTFDWSDVLTDIQDTIAHVDFILAGGLTGGDSHANGALATVFVAAGVSAEVSITCRITTNSVPPRIEDRTAYLKMVDQ
jgi:hypothetical protein